MIKDIFTSLLSITKGIHKDSTTERAYTELNKKLNINASYKTTPLFSINFTERDFGSKRKYYKKLIDNEASKKFNKLIDSFPENVIEHDHIFNYQIIFNEFKQYLIEVDEYIEKYNYDRTTIQEENTYVIQYLKTNMIWLFLELQERFAKYGDEDYLSIEEVYKFYFNEVLDEIEIIPYSKKEPVIATKEETTPFRPISNDLPQRPIKKNILKYNDIVKDTKSFSRAEQIMFEADIIDKDYNFVYNAAKKNKSILGILYILFIQKGYFNSVRTTPFKKIKNTDIVKFLNNRYNTDARKQFKIFENDAEKRNELISNEYFLQNLPNKIR
ncbi:DUF6617 family protein [uncultured Polaribacter sp.]|uniref:DUF6617 family protein n=1 Tax=uncultured Polaribacter sp. TaxID=174711 RepID=UPI00259B1DA1|nr:DUF6617 family protein [uncultured Polaribacter sp.]